MVQRIWFAIPDKQGGHCATLTYPNALPTSYARLFYSSPSGSSTETFSVIIPGSGPVSLKIRTYDPVYVWVNGTAVLTQSDYSVNECQVYGVDISAQVKPGQMNQILVQVGPDPAGQDASHWINEGWIEIEGIACTQIYLGGTIETSIGTLKLISTDPTLIRLIKSAVVDIGGTQYKISEGEYVDISGDGLPGIKVGVFDITFLACTICVQESTGGTTGSGGTTVPPVFPPAGGTTGGTVVLPPPPVLDACVLPELSWNFIEVVRQAVLYISCNLGNLIVQVSWLVSVLAALIPQILAAITYFLSLKWITDWIQAFFDRLDIWISAKFGIDPTLPFFEELVKKAIGWLSEGLNEAARKATERLK
jgi:hypothetical protein